MTRKKPRPAGWLLLCIGSGIVFGACTVFQPDGLVMTPPSMPGAEYVGTETCAGCHEDEHKYFRISDHASVSIDLSDEDVEAGAAEGCETCHGPGSLHVEGMGDKSKIVRSDAVTTCYSCHLNIKGKFQLQHHHPVPEGRMSCTDCHDMHGSDVRATGGSMLLGMDEKCFKCHKEQRGPYVFEHDAMRDGCQSCHNAHGSINDKLLIAGQTTTCLRCHWEVAFNTGSGGIGNIEHGDYAIGQGEECIDHHRAPHGSNIWRTFNR